jgi:hypothetical protein
MDFILKDKITVTKEFLGELELKSWQEIEQLQAQINSLAENDTTSKIRQLLTNLLTSYYVFTGGVEALKDTFEATTNDVTSTEMTNYESDTEPQVAQVDELDIEEAHVLKHSEIDEPFEYFVDFDEPTGEPVTDQDLYEN